MTKDEIHERVLRATARADAALVAYDAMIRAIPVPPSRPLAPFAKSKKRKTPDEQ